MKIPIFARINILNMKKDITCFMPYSHECQPNRTLEAFMRHPRVAHIYLLVQSPLNDEEIPAPCTQLVVEDLFFPPDSRTRRYSVPVTLYQKSIPGIGIHGSGATR